MKWWPTSASLAESTSEPFHQPNRLLLNPLLFHRFMYGEEGNGWFYDELFARGVSEDTIRLRNEIRGSSLLTRVVVDQGEIFFVKTQRLVLRLVLLKYWHDNLVSTN